jgi:hypothetical protein
MAFTAQINVKKICVKSEARKSRRPNRIIKCAAIMPRQRYING